MKLKIGKQILEWIRFDRFENVEYLAERGFRTAYKAILERWTYKGWNSKNNQWNRIKAVCIMKLSGCFKCLYNLQYITTVIFKVVRCFFTFNLYIKC